MSENKSPDLPEQFKGFDDEQLRRVVDAANAEAARRNPPNLATMSDHELFQYTETMKANARKAALNGGR